MNREEAIKHKLCPQWLKDASWYGEVELMKHYPYVIFKRGIWEGGTWEGGIWEGGTWKGGFKRIGQCYWGAYYSKTRIIIGCKAKTVEQWKEWFASDRVYQHKRDSEQFKKIEQAFKLACYAIELEGEGAE